MFLGLVAGSFTKREFSILFYQTMPPQGGPLIAFFSTLLKCNVTIQDVSVESCPEKDNDWISFDTAEIQRINKRAHGDDAKTSCQLQTKDLVRYLAGLDHQMETGCPHNSSGGRIPDHQRDCVKGMLAEGRLLIGAQLSDNGDVLHLTFGEPDAAISRYR